MAAVARRHEALTTEICQLDASFHVLVADAAPERFLAKQGVADQVASTLLAAGGDNPGRLRTEASFAAADYPPVPTYVDPRRMPLTMPFLAQYDSRNGRPR
jgi:transposase